MAHSAAKRRVGSMHSFPHRTHDSRKTVNIVALVDLFENVDYYYIVLEYMQGKDLFDYIEFRKFKLSENRVK